MKTLVLAEKPSVGKDIARVLHCKSKDTFMENNKYVVTWALGHLVTLADPESYNIKYKTWNIDELPIIPNKIKLSVIKKTNKQFNIVKSLLLRTDIKDIIIATDAGREGELVARLILEKAKIKKPIKRLWISSVTDKAIEEGFNNLKNGSNYNNLYKSAFARATADWLVGINATRALTTKYNANLSCGRVQTPTLSIIMKKEEEIKNFKPQQYFITKFFVENLEFTWHDKESNSTKIFNKEDSDKLINSLKNKNPTVTNISRKSKKLYPDKLYDLTTLQRDANALYDFSPKETLSILQKLYEHHKILTYPRTDSRYISTDIIPTLRDRLKAISIGEYKKFASKILNNDIVTNKSFVDNSKVSDHHAIIPTEEYVNLSNLTSNEIKIYNLVIKKFLSVFLPPYEYEEVKITAKLENEVYICTNNFQINLGFKEIFGEENNEKRFKNIHENDILQVTSYKQIKEQTSPPKRFTEGSILEAMENPIKYMDGNNSLNKTLKETGGLGTVATRADILDKLFNSNFIEKKDKYIYITQKGKQLLNIAPPELCSPKLTAMWEQKLEKISKGKLSDTEFIKEIEEYTKSITEGIKNDVKKYKHDNITNSKCPKCNKLMLEITNKHGKFLVCQDKTCNTKRTIYLNTNARCPKCNKKMMSVGEGENKKFICSCGYKENLNAFKERKKNSQTISKKDVQKYLNKINNNKEINNPFATAFEKLNLK